MLQQSTSLNVTDLLENHLAHDANANWYCAPEIPAKKLKNALLRYADNVPAADILALGDGTVFGSGDSCQYLLQWYQRGQILGSIIEHCRWQETGGLARV